MPSTEGTDRTVYTETVAPLDVDHSDSAIAGSIAWHLAQAREQGGGVIHLTEGEYIVSEGLFLTDNISIIGAGKETVIRGDDSLDDHLMHNEFSDISTGPGVQNVSVQSMTLIGKRDVRKNCVQIVAGNDNRSASILVRDLYVHECGRHGVHIKGANDVVVQDSEFYDNGVNIYHDHNLYLLRVTDANVRNIYTTGSSSNGFSSTRLQNAHLSEITSEKNGNRGLRFGGGVRVAVKNCTARENGLLSAYNADGIVVTSDDYSNQSRDIRIRACTSERNPGSGIAVDWVDEVLLEHNTIQSNNECGIRAVRSIVQTKQNSDTDNSNNVEHCYLEN